MKKILSLLLLINLAAIGCSSNAQINDKVLALMKSDFARISFHKLIFSEAELVEFCKDSVGQETFNSVFSKFKSSIPLMKDGDLKEFKIIVELIYNNVNKVKGLNSGQVAGKKFLLETLKNYRTDFTVDEALLVECFDSSKRGTTHGDEECSVSYSKYIFLIYNPGLYKDVLQKNKSISKDGGVYLPLKCTLKEDDGLLAIRKVMQVRLLNLLDRYTDTAFYELKKRIRESGFEEIHD